jgi:UDP-3-O-[3-hydroxymyristoyl] N-acetylglucosamine deacetylase
VDAGAQQTIAAPVALRGVGLHTGRAVEMVLRPAPEHAGIVFRRPGRGDGAVIPAALPAVTGTAHCVALGGAGGVHTVEHLLSAAWALGVDNLEVELSDAEVPGMDGSALPFARALRAAGLRAQAAPRRVLRVREPVWAARGGGWAVALPWPRFVAACVVTVDPPGPGDQAATYDPARDAYEETIAPARTWGYARDAEALRAQGLALGASLENTLVVGGPGFLNPPRFGNEPARHKLLDLLGDLALLGQAVCGAVLTVRAGHGLHVALAQALSAQGG